MWFIALSERHARSKGGKPAAGGSKGFLLKFQRHTFPHLAKPALVMHDPNEKKNALIRAQSSNSWTTQLTPFVNARVWRTRL